MPAMFLTVAGFALTPRPPLPRRERGSKWEPSPVPGLDHQTGFAVGDDVTHVTDVGRDDGQLSQPRLDECSRKAFGSAGEQHDVGGREGRPRIEHAPREVDAAGGS